MLQIKKRPLSEVHMDITKEGLEQEITDLEIQTIEQEQTITDLEIELEEIKKRLPDAE